MRHLLPFLEETVRGWSDGKRGTPNCKIVPVGRSILIKCFLSNEDRPISILFDEDDFLDLEPQAVADIVTFRLDLELEVRR